MANLAGGGVTVVGLAQTQRITQLLTSGMAETDIGGPVTQDTTANNRVKPSADGDIIFGVLESYEDRVQEGVKTGTVSRKGGHRLTYKTGDGVAVGDSIVAAGAGEVKKTITANNTIVTAVNATDRTVEVIFN